MKLFVEPVIEVEKFELVDVITTSVDIPPETTEPTTPDWGMGGEDF